MSPRTGPSRSGLLSWVREQSGDHSVARQVHPQVFLGSGRRGGRGPLEAGTCFRGMSLKGAGQFARRRLISNRFGRRPLADVPPPGAWIRYRVPSVLWVPVSLGALFLLLRDDSWRAAAGLMARLKSIRIEQMDGPPSPGGARLVFDPPRKSGVAPGWGRGGSVTFPCDLSVFVHAALRIRAL